MLGQSGDALVYLRESLHLADQLEYVAGVAAAERLLASALVDLLAFDEAADRLRRSLSLAREAGAGLFADIAVLALVQTLAARAHPEDLAEAGELLDNMLAGTRLPGGRLQREALAVRAELDLARGKAEAALATLEGLIANTRHLADWGLPAIPRVALLLGRALMATGRAREAEEVLRAAVTGAEALGRKPLLWRADAALGRLYVSLKQRRLAQDRFGHARVVISALAETLPDATLRKTFTEKALATLPTAPAATARRTDVQAHHGLTERERAVAELIADGRSNREIGDALVISERTAERHVANILGKLGLASRVQLAAWVAENRPSR
jgi:DNA-binding CsgD family transcriptional regulator